MDPFTALMIGGTALQVYGNVKANLDQAEAEAQNAVWMREQADFMAKSTQRELGIFNRESLDQMASLENTFAKSGISMVGSAFEVQRQEELKRQNELQAISDQGKMNIKEAMLKATASDNNANKLRSFGYNALQGATAAVNSGEKYASYKASQK